MVEPANAVITLNEKTIENNHPVALPGGVDKVNLRIEHPGFKAWAKEFSRKEIKDNLQLHVDMSPIP